MFKICLTVRNCVSETVLPKNLRFQGKAVLGVWKCLSVLHFLIATKLYLETTGGCYLVRLITIELLFIYFFKGCK